jgi:hypothetical protein
MLTPMRVDFGVGEVGQPAAVIEVHVGKDDVPHFFRIVSQPPDPIHSRFVGVKGHDGDDAEKFRHPAWVGVFVQSKSRIHENQPLIGFDQETDHAGFQAAGQTGVAGEAIEQVNGHWHI